MSILIGYFAQNSSLSASTEAERLRSLTIEELVNIDVTLVSKTEQSLAQSAAAIFVINQDDIRRSGATKIPELLRMVPGLQVVRIDANRWAITARGFNGRFANKLLVLMDGRSLYTPLNGGVYWEVQDTLLEDIERIEVIRGPGATLWGSNAVNGIINIVTQSAQDTQGGLVSVGFGNEERHFGGLRYGGNFSGRTFVRAYLKGASRDGSVDWDGQATPDEGSTARGGFRIDVEPSLQDHLTVQGDAYSAEFSQISHVPSVASLVPPYMPPFLEELVSDTDASGLNVLGRWRHQRSPDSEFTWQLYYDRTEWQELTFGEVRDTFDLDFQDRLSLSGRHNLIWGVGYRASQDEIKPTVYTTARSLREQRDIWNVFLQDEISFLEDRLWVTVGAKLETNEHTGAEFQPNLRALWRIGENQVMWGAVSRAVRAPGRFDDDVELRAFVIPPGVLPLPPGVPEVPAVATILGQRDFQSEELLAYELGYRAWSTDQLFFDAAIFYNIYDDLRTFEPRTPFLAPEDSFLILPLELENNMQGQTYGMELALDWNPLEPLRFKFAYAFLEGEFELDPQSADVGRDNAFENLIPRHQWSLRTWLDLSGNVELDLWMRYTAELQRANTADPSFAIPVDEFFALDARLAWHPRRNLELMLVGKNLLDDAHLEFVEEVYTHLYQVQRSIYAQLRWAFE